MRLRLQVRHQLRRVSFCPERRHRDGGLGSGAGEC
ncbi:hypothetical protein LINPERPRIM_LOCUS15654 [Linum perenne]